MRADRPRVLREQIGRVLYSHVPAWVIYVYVIALTLSYIVVLAHTPLALNPTAVHDDGLFMRLGSYLSEGKWLGPFNQFTLMKGPGYPAFLALGHWLGISVSLAHALFHCATITFFVVVAHRFVGSLVLSGVLLALLLWHPISMTEPMLGVSREEIYYGQILIVLAALLYALFYASGNKQGNLFATLGGAVLGWSWLTREEGVWIIPAIGLLLAVAGLCAFRKQRIQALTGTVLIFFGVFTATQICFRGTNWLVYGKFVGVDVKERSFERALGAIHSIRSGGVQPFVSITRAARKQVYSVSPAFASLSRYFDTPPDQGWAGLTCNLAPSLCGEIGAGWFLWALRDAAAADGHYQTPAKASAFFAQIADEIVAACASGALECSPQLIPAIPPVNWQQIAELLPSRVLRACRLLIMAHPPLQFNRSSGTRDQLDASLRFLNYPPHTPPPASYTLSGWYYKFGSREWISVEVRGADGLRVEVGVDRNSSPDLERAFKDPAASRQRFIIRTRCDDNCVMQFHGWDGANAVKSLAELRRAPIGFKLGSGNVHVDSTEIRSDAASIEQHSQVISNSIRMNIASHYSLGFLPVLVLGLVAFLITTLLQWRRAAANMCYIMAFTSWMLVMLRAALLILIDVTSFPALEPFYLAPAYFFLVSGAVFSCAACLELFVEATYGEMARVARAEASSKGCIL